MTTRGTREVHVARVHDGTKTSLLDVFVRYEVRALAFVDSSLVFIADDGKLYTAALAGEDWAPRAVADKIEGERLLLAANREHAWIAGGSRCALERHRLTATEEGSTPSCVAKEFEPCAIASGDGYLFATTADGELLRFDAKDQQIGLAYFAGACGVAVSDKTVNLVANEGVYSLPTSGGKPTRLLARIDESPRRRAGVNRQRFYWLEGATLNGVLIDQR